MEATTDIKEKRVRYEDANKWERHSLFANPLYYEDERRKAIKGTDKLRHLLSKGMTFGFEAHTILQHPDTKIAEVRKSLIYVWGEPTVLPQIEKAIELSKYILELPENWDEEDSPSYARETWDRATQFTRRTALQYKKSQGQIMPTPEITHGPDGSIDVRWENGGRSLLLNFPANKETPVDFFGVDDENYSIQGTVKLSSQNEWLLAWLMSQYQTLK